MAIQIALQAKTPLEVIEPTVFSHNLEHTRSCIYQGLSAQLLRNRKFAGKPAAHSGEAAEWYKIGEKQVYLTLDRFDPYTRHVAMWGAGILLRRNELNAQVVQNPFEGQEAGIGQAALHLEKGKTYEVRAVLKAHSDQALTGIIRIAGPQTDASGVFPLPQDQWHAVSFTFIAQADTDNACFEVLTRNLGALSIGVVSLLPMDNVLGLRPDVIENLRHLAPACLRWPGGNFAGEYHWKDGLLDIDQRGPQKSVREIETHPYTCGFDFHEMAIDDFIQLCRLVDAEPYLTINIGRDSAEECAQLVEYCNGAADTAWGKIRVERGFPEPYRVRYWSLGNELGLGHMEGPNTPEAYTRKAIEYARAMRGVDPNIILFASGAYAPEHDYRDWIDQSLPALAAEGIDYISYHNYLPRIFEGGADFVTQAGLKNTYERLIQAPLQCLADVERLRQAMDAKGCAKVRISYDEWNVYFAWYHDPGVMEGLYTALMLEMFIKNFKRVNMPMVMYFQPINEGAIVVHPGQSELTANGQVMALMKSHKGKRLLDAVSADSRVHCVASQSDATGERVATLINCDYSQAVTVSFAADLGAPVAAVLYEGTSLLIGSRFTQQNIPAHEGTFALPAHSILQVQFQN